MIVWVRGMGELGSAVAHLLFRMGYKVFGTELANPLAIRRPVCFSEVMYDGETEVQGVRAIQVNDIELEPIWSKNILPVLIDDPEKTELLKPNVIVDARLLKKQVDDLRLLAPIGIGLGPGFTAQQNCSIAVETVRGHDLGRLILDGETAANTGIPGALGGVSAERLVYSPGDGSISWKVNFGESVGKGQKVATINNSTPVHARTEGIVRGMINEQVAVLEGMKIGDVDPRGGAIDYKLISEKARLTAYGVLEAIMLQTKGVEHE